MFVNLNGLNFACDVGRSDFGAQFIDMEELCAGPHFNLVKFYFTIGSFYIKLKLSWGDYGYASIKELTVMQVTDLRNALAERREKTHEPV